MTSSVIMDTGPLVAYFQTASAHHEWAVSRFASFTGPILTCEAVLTETTFLLLRARKPSWGLIDRVIDGTFTVEWRFNTEAERVRALMKQYQDQPMSFADACLVRMAEMTKLPICTLDSDFFVYRTGDRNALTVISP